MGGMKRMMEEQEARYHWARDFLVEVGTLQACELHEGDFFDGDGDLERAYKVFNARVTNGQITIEDGLTRRDMTDTLKEVYHDNNGPDSCNSCARHLDD